MSNKSTSVTSWYQFAAEKRPLKRHYKHVSGGPPDVHPQDARQEEDNLSYQRLTKGYQVPLNSYEHDSLMMNSRGGRVDRVGDLGNKTLTLISSTIMRKLDPNGAMDKDRKRFRENSNAVFSSGVNMVISKAERDTREFKMRERCSWFSDLARGKPLSTLAKKIPAFHKQREDALEYLCDYNVPLHRAVWYLKVTAALTATSSNKPKKMSPELQALEYSLFFNRMISDLIGQMWDIHDLESSEIYKHKWCYHTAFIRRAFDEGVLDKQEFLNELSETFVEFFLDGNRLERHDLLRVFLVFLGQFVKHITTSLLLARRTAHALAMKLRLIEIDWQERHFDDDDKCQVEEIIESDDDLTDDGEESNGSTTESTSTPAYTTDGGSCSDSSDWEEYPEDPYGPEHQGYSYATVSNDPSTMQGLIPVDQQPTRPHTPSQDPAEKDDNTLLNGHVPSNDPDMSSVQSHGGPLPIASTNGSAINPNDNSALPFPGAQLADFSYGYDGYSMMYAGSGVDVDDDHSDDSEQPVPSPKSPEPVDLFGLCEKYCPQKLQRPPKRLQKKKIVNGVTTYHDDDIVILEPPSPKKKKKTKRVVQLHKRGNPGFLVAPLVGSVREDLSDECHLDKAVEDIMRKRRKKAARHARKHGHRHKKRKHREIVLNRSYACRSPVVEKVQSVCVTTPVHIPPVYDSIEPSRNTERTSPELGMIDDGMRYADTYDDMSRFAPTSPHFDDVQRNNSYQAPVALPSVPLNLRCSYETMEASLSNTCGMDPWSAFRQTPEPCILSEDVEMLTFEGHDESEVGMDWQGLLESSDVDENDDETVFNGPPRLDYGPVTHVTSSSNDTGESAAAPVISQSMASRNTISLSSDTVMEVDHDEVDVKPDVAKLKEAMMEKVKKESTPVRAQDKTEQPLFGSEKSDSKTNDPDSKKETETSLDGEETVTGPTETSTDGGAKTKSKFKVRCPVDSFVEMMKCEGQRENIFMLTAMLQTIVVEAPAAVVWNYFKVGTQRLPCILYQLCGSPLDLLPCPVYDLPAPDGELSERTVEVVKMRTKEIIRRSQAVQDRWAFDLKEQYECDVNAKVDGVLDVIGIMDAAELFDPNVVPKCAQLLFGKKERWNGEMKLRVKLMMEWAITEGREGSYRPCIVCKILHYVVNVIKMDHFNGVPVQKLVENFFDVDAPQPGAPHFSEEFGSLMALFLELQRFGLFSIDDMCKEMVIEVETDYSLPVYEIYRPAVVEPPVVGEMTVQQTFNLSQTLLMDTEFEMKKDDDSVAVADAVASVPEVVAEDVKPDVKIPEDVKIPIDESLKPPEEVPAEPEKPPVMTGLILPSEPNAEERPHLTDISWYKHRILIQVPIPQTEKYLNDSNQRDMIMYGLNEQRKEHIDGLKKIAREICKVWEKKIYIKFDDSSSNVWCPRRITTEKLHEVLTPFRKQTYHDQLVIASWCAENLSDMLQKFCDATSLQCPTKEAFDIVCQMFEHSQHVFGIFEMAAGVLNWLQSVDRVIRALSSDVIPGSLSNQIAHVFVAYCAKHWIFFIHSGLAASIANSLYALTEKIMSAKDYPKTSWSRVNAAFVFHIKQQLKSSGLADRKIRGCRSDWKQVFNTGKGKGCGPQKYNSLFFKDAFENMFLQHYSYHEYKKRLPSFALMHNRYSFVINSFIAVKGCERDHNIISDLAAFCGHYSAEIPELADEWITAIKALCCVGQTHFGYHELVQEVDVRDCSTHYPLATFVMLLGSKYAFSIPRLIAELLNCVLPIIMKKDPGAAIQQKDLDQEAGVCLALHILAAICTCKDEPFTMSTQYTRVKEKTKLLPKCADDYILSIMQWCEMDTVLFPMLSNICILQDTLRNRHRELDLEMPLLGESDTDYRKYRKEYLTILVRTVLLTICEQDWVTFKMWKIVTSNNMDAFNHDRLKQNCLGQQLLRMGVRRRCEKQVLQDLMICNSASKKALIDKLLAVVDIWNFRATLFDLMLMIKEISPEGPQKHQHQLAIAADALIGEIGKCCKDMFIVAYKEKKEMPKAVKNEDFTIRKISKFWLIGSLLRLCPEPTNVPSQFDNITVAGKFLKEAAVMLDISAEPGNSGRAVHRERLRQSAWLLSQHAFINMILACMTWDRNTVRNPDKLEANNMVLVQCIHKQLSDIVVKIKENPSLVHAQKYSPEREGVILRITVVGRIFKQICNPIHSDSWALLFFQMMLHGIVTPDRDKVMYDSIYDMLSTLMLWALTDPNTSSQQAAEQGDTQPKFRWPSYCGIIKKLRKELGETRVPKNRRSLLQFLTIPKSSWDLLCFEPYGTPPQPSTKSLKTVQRQPPVHHRRKTSKIGIQVYEKQKVTPYDFIQYYVPDVNLTKPTGWRWQYFMAARVDKYPFFVPTSLSELIMHNHIKDFTKDSYMRVESTAVDPYLCPPPGEVTTTPKLSTIPGEEGPKGESIKAVMASLDDDKKMDDDKTKGDNEHDKGVTDQSPKKEDHKDSKKTDVSMRQNEKVQDDANDSDVMNVSNVSASSGHTDTKSAADVEVLAMPAPICAPSSESPKRQRKRQSQTKQGGGQSKQKKQASRQDLSAGMAHSALGQQQMPMTGSWGAQGWTGYPQQPAPTSMTQTAYQQPGSKPVAVASTFQTPQQMPNQMPSSGYPTQQMPQQPSGGQIQQPSTNPQTHQHMQMQSTPVQQQMQSSVSSTDDPKMAIKKMIKRKQQGNADHAQATAGMGGPPGGMAGGYQGMGQSGAMSSGSGMGIMGSASITSSVGSSMTSNTQSMSVDQQKMNSAQQQQRQAGMQGAPAMGYTTKAHAQFPQQQHQQQQQGNEYLNQMGHRGRQQMSKTAENVPLMKGMDDMRKRNLDQAQMKNDELGIADQSKSRTSSAQQQRRRSTPQKDANPMGSHSTGLGAGGTLNLAPGSGAMPIGTGPGAMSMGTVLGSGLTASSSATSMTNYSMNRSAAVNYTAFPATTGVTGMTSSSMGSGGSMTAVGTPYGGTNPVPPNVGMGGPNAIGQAMGAAFAQPYNPSIPQGQNTKGYPSNYPATGHYQQ